MNELRDKPIEFLEKHGASLLSSAQLLAVVLEDASVTFSETLEVVEKLLSSYNGDLRRLADDVHLQQLEKLESLDQSMLAKVSATFELGRRMVTYLEQKPQIQAPADVARLMTPKLRNLKNEVLYVLCLDTKNFVLNQRKIFEGTLNASIAHPREVFRFAIQEAAASIILVHNHPSGDPTPSREDISSTDQMIEAGKCIDIPMLDHVIVGDGRFVSLKEEGFI